MTKYAYIIRMDSNLLNVTSFYLVSYKQRRFNLFREESEGYAKLITELNNEAIQHTSVSKILEIVKSLIGTWRYKIILHFEQWFLWNWSIKIDLPVI